MKKLITSILFILVMAGVSVAGPFQYVGNDKGKLDRFETLWIGSSTAVCLISTVTGTGAGYTDSLITNYSTNTYCLMLSTTPNMAEPRFNYTTTFSSDTMTGNIYDLEPGESISPSGILGEGVPVFGKFQKFAPISRVKLIKFIHKFQ